MSLYGPKLKLPKVELPSVSEGPSWNLDKEKKIAIYGAAVVLILLAIFFLGPILLNSIGNWLEEMLNPAVQVSWKNNPLDLTKGVYEADLDLLLVNTSKTEQKEVTFNITTNSNEVIIFCPNSIYDINKSAYTLENLSPGDKRKIPCIVRRNPNESVFTGSYTLDITTSLGNTKTILEIISK